MSHINGIVYNSQPLNPPKDSWWAKASPQGFTAVANDEWQKRMRHSQFGTLKYISHEGKEAPTTKK